MCSSNMQAHSFPFQSRIVFFISAHPGYWILSEQPR
jgi:hypothetical protein